MSDLRTAARTYNQTHIPRKYTSGKRRISIYWTWSYPWETQRDPAEMENRFSTITEVRNVTWPAYETPEFNAAQFLQGIAGTLELFHRSTLSFQQVAGEVSGHPVAVFQRIDQAGYKLPIDERILADTDTLMVFGLDHLLSEQEAAPEEIAAISEWLKREGTCLVLAPHHDVGFTNDITIGVWVGYDNASGKRRTLGGGQTGGREKDDSGYDGEPEFAGGGRRGCRDGARRVGNLRGVVCGGGTRGIHRARIHGAGGNGRA